MAVPTTILPVAIPHLQPNEKVKDWRIGYTAATSALQEEEKISFLPLVVDRSLAEQKWACEAAKKKSLIEALDELELRLDERKTRFQAMTEFFSLKPSTTTSPVDISELFFNTWDAGKLAGVANDVIAVKFLQQLPTASKLFSENEEKIKQEMSDSDLIMLFDATKERLARKATEGGKLDNSVMLTAETETVPKWAEELQIQIAALETRMKPVAPSERVSCEEKVSLPPESRVKKIKRICNICGKMNHTEQKCFKRVCSRCRGKGHDAEKCRRKR